MFRPRMFFAAAACLVCLGLEAQENPAAAPTPSITVGTYPQEVATKYTTAEGLPGNNALSLTVDAKGNVWVGTTRGAASFADGKWTVFQDSTGYDVGPVAMRGNELIAIADGALYGVDGGVSELTAAPSYEVSDLAAAGNVIYAGTKEGLHRFETGNFQPVQDLNNRLGDDKSIRQIAVGPNGTVAVAAAGGLYEFVGDAWQEVRAQDGTRSWAPADVRGVAYDSQGRLWFASPQGAGVRGPEGWKLYTGQEGLPYNDFTTVATAPDGSVWFGTKKGAIHFDGTTWEYRQGLRWLPDDKVHDIAVDAQNRAWFATDSGVGLIADKPMTLMEKARFFEEAIDKYHRRTPYGYVLQVALPKPGDTSSWKHMDSDNDGLWTSMYGAGECFAYGATKDPFFKERAQKAFQALKFLMDVTQGGNPPAQPGFVARTILPTSGPNPNEKDYTPEKDRKKQEEDKLWKIVTPRWPTSADGQWYWKSDTSSDELDGHYFFHALYYDLVCETEEEKQGPREFIVALTDHLMRNGFQFIDHDGKPTRWAVYDPERFNGTPEWYMERGLNALSILSYLATAHHVTGDAKYTEAMDRLVDEHGYAINMMVPKIHMGPGSGNQSDDEMAFMSYYNLLRYTPKESKAREIGAYSLWTYSLLEEPEMNPLFNFISAALLPGEVFHTAFADIKLNPFGNWLEHSVDQLKRYPLDRLNWAHDNTHRIDIVRLPNYTRDPDQFDSKRPFHNGYRNNGYVVPIDEQFVEHWNHNPWELRTGGNGGELADGASFLLPYYMGLYHGFVK